MIKEAPGRVVDVVLVDDHAIVRQGLQAMLDREPDLCVVGEAGDVTTAMRVIGELQPSVVVLDLKLSAGSDTDGLDLCAEIVQAYPEVGVLVLTTFLDETLVIRAIQQGARGYVVKDVDTSALLRAIRDVSEGQSFFDARSSAAMVRGLNTPKQSARDELTARELEVLTMLAAGLSNRQIGQRLYISETTAKFHVGNILRKLGVTRRAEAVYTASKQGLI